MQLCIDWMMKKNVYAMAKYEVGTRCGDNTQPLVTTYVD